MVNSMVTGGVNKFVYTAGV